MTLRVRAGGKERLREIAAGFGAVSKSGVRAGEPSVSELLDMVISGELVIVRKGAGDVLGSECCQWSGCSNPSTRITYEGHHMVRECGQPDCARYRFAAPVVTGSIEAGYTLLKPGMRDGVLLIPAGVTVPATLIPVGTEVIECYVESGGPTPVERERRVRWGE